jgi:hypothetical protein
MSAELKLLLNFKWTLPPSKASTWRFQDCCRYCIAHRSWLSVDNLGTQGFCLY